MSISSSFPLSPPKTFVLWETLGKNLSIPLGRWVIVAYFLLWENRIFRLGRCNQVLKIVVLRTSSLRRSWSGWYSPTSGVCLGPGHDRVRCIFTVGASGAPRTSDVFLVFHSGQNSPVGLETKLLPLWVLFGDFLNHRV